MIRRANDTVAARLHFSLESLLARSKPVTVAQNAAAACQKESLFVYQRGAILT